MDTTRITRRQFFKDTSCFFFNSLLFAHTGIQYGGDALCVKATKAKNLPHMEYRPLGKTGLKVSAVSMGTAITREPAVLYKALDMGINYFDTAHGYLGGYSEMMIGNVLKEYGRSRAFIATKIPPINTSLYTATGKSVLHTTTEMERMTEKSLQRLQTDYVDVLMLHSIMDSAWVVNEDMLSFLEKQKKTGKARFVGFSFHNQGPRYQKILEQALTINLYDVFLVPVNFKTSAAFLEKLKRVKEKGVGIVAMKTQGGGFKNPGAGYKTGVAGFLWPYLKEALKRSQGTLIEPYLESILKACWFLKTHQAALKWVLNCGFVDCAVPGMVNYQQLMENVSVVGKRVTRSDREILDSYYASIKELYCLRCEACLYSCKNDVDIPAIHRALMYKDGYRNFELGLSAYLEQPPQKSAASCMNCDSPTCICLNGINIAERMRYAHASFV